MDVRTVATDESDSAEQVQQRETVEQLYKAIHQLPQTDAALVLLYLDERRKLEHKLKLDPPESEKAQDAEPARAARLVHLGAAAFFFTGGRTDPPQGSGQG